MPNFNNTAIRNRLYILSDKYEELIMGYQLFNIARLQDSIITYGDYNDEETIIVGKKTDLYASKLLEISTDPYLNINNNRSGVLITIPNDNANTNSIIIGTKSANEIDEVDNGIWNYFKINENGIIIASKGTNGVKVIGDTTLNNKLTVVGNTSLGKTLTVGGATTLNDKLTVVGDTLLKSTLKVSGDSYMYSSLYVGPSNGSSKIAISDKYIQRTILDDNEKEVESQLTLNPNGGLVKIGTGGLSVEGDTSLGKTSIAGKLITTANVNYGTAAPTSGVVEGEVFFEYI